MDHLEQALKSNAFVRYIGILCLGLGALFASLTVYPQIAAARAGKPIISIHRYGVGATFGVLLCGVIFLAAGRDIRRFMVLKWRDATLLQVCGTLLLVGACAAFQAWFERYFAGLGFVVRKLP